MTIDERIEALAKRHEDGMLEIELLRGMMKDSLAKSDQIDEQIAALTSQVANVAHLVLSHERRERKKEGN